MRCITLTAFGCILLGCGVPAPVAGGSEDYPIRPVTFTDVRLDDVFWRPRIECDRTVTIPFTLLKCGEYRIPNFAKAAKRVKGDFQGDPFEDSDVYKVLEGAIYCLATNRDPALEKQVDEIIALIAAAQEPDGYLYTARTIHGEKAPGRATDKRWLNDCEGYRPDLGCSHETYNVGHLYEAAVAHFLATGKRTLLDVAVKNADLIARTWGPGPDQLKIPPGHQEIELALVKLARVTGDRKYIELSKFLLECRGRGHLQGDKADYHQDHLPVTRQRSIHGHAVRAGYMVSGMTDIAALLGDKEYAEAVDALWEDSVAGKLYVHGGVGSVGNTEGFGEAFELPNNGHMETCAAVALSLWNHRLFLLHGDAKYIDVLERSLYNGFLSGVSLSGDRFFYCNPLVSHGGNTRGEGITCCVVNICRFLPSVPGFCYAATEGAIYVNLFAAGNAKVVVDGAVVRLKQETRYPWDGTVKIVVTPEKPAAFTLRVRVPGWARNRPVPSDLYRYLDGAGPAPTLALNGKNQEIREEKGYAAITRTWNAGDTVTLTLPMPVRRLVADEKVKADAGRVALQRGPVLYCVEGIDHGGIVRHLSLPDDAALVVEHRKDLLGGVTVITGTALASRRDPTGLVSDRTVMTAVPYYAWTNRDSGTMQVWLARKPERAQALPLKGIAATAKLASSPESGGLPSVNDGIEPADSSDIDVPRFGWSRKGTEEWIQMEFEEPAEVSSAEIYWFSDRHWKGSCEVPASWELLVPDGDQWKPVAGASGYGVEADKYNRVTFTPVKTKALRLRARLRPGLSAGVLEWKVE